MRFCVISTGGTIASSPGDEGLTPTMRGEQLLSHIPDLQRSGSVSVVDLLSKDSSNMHPDDWARIARCVLERRDEADGFLILHGTDTMAYTASALSYMLLGFDRPVVLQDIGCGGAIGAATLKPGGDRGNLVPQAHVARDIDIVHHLQFVRGAGCRHRNNSRSEQHDGSAEKNGGGEGWRV